MEWNEQYDRMYTRPTKEQRRIDEISASMKHIHDTQQAYCQMCWMKYNECPGHSDDGPREHGAFYVQLLKERTLLREAVEAGDLALVDALEALECVFDRYHLRMEYENRVGVATGNILKEFDEVQEDWMRSIPLQLGEPLRREVDPRQGHVHTKVEGDQLKEQGHFAWPGRGFDTRVEPLEPRELEFNVGGERPDVVITPQDDVQVSSDRYTEEFRRQVATQLVQQQHDDGEPWPEEGLGTMPLKQEGGPIDPNDWMYGDDEPEEGRKDDAGKARWDLLPPSIEHVVDVYTFGAYKYDDDNWAKGMGWRRIFGAMMRHGWKWFWGEKYDPETGCPHLASVAWGALTLMHYEDAGVGTDDRAFKPMEKQFEPPLGVVGRKVKLKPCDADGNPLNLEAYR